MYPIDIPGLLASSKFGSSSEGALAAINEGRFGTPLAHLMSR